MPRPFNKPGASPELATVPLRCSRLWRRAHLLAVLVLAHQLVAFLGLPTRQVWAQCLGDCDDSGNVGAGDLTKIIALMLYCPCSGSLIGADPNGCAALPGGLDKQCLNADRNGNGCITAGELTGVIANIIDFPDTGCPPAPTPTNTPVTPPSATETPTSALSPTITSTIPATPTEALTWTPTETASATVTASATNSPSATMEPTASGTATVTQTATPAPLPSDTATATQIPTATNAAAPSDTPTANPTLTATATATATATPGTVCGNSVIEPGETCTTCAVDCTVHSCSATTPVHTVKVNLAIPADQTVSGLTLLIGYRSGTVSLPGSGAASSVGSRIKNKPTNTIFAYNDVDYALRTVLSRSSGFAAGQLYTIDFDSCQGAAAPTIADFACTVEGCSNTFGTVDGCTCSVSF